MINRRGTLSGARSIRSPVHLLGISRSKRESNVIGHMGQEVFGAPEASANRMHWDRK